MYAICPLAPGLLTTTTGVPSSFSNPLAGLQAWCGATSYFQTIADVSAYAGQTVQFRLRLGSDTSVGKPGWDVDDVTVHSCAPDVPDLCAGLTLLAASELVVGSFAERDWLEEYRRHARPLAVGRRLWIDPCPTSPTHRAPFARSNETRHGARKPSAQISGRASVRPRNGLSAGIA